LWGKGKEDGEKLSKNEESMTKGKKNNLLGERLSYHKSEETEEREKKGKRRAGLVGGMVTRGPKSVTKMFVGEGDEQGSTGQEQKGRVARKVPSQKRFGAK